ncbi:MAG TPA: DoxX family protein [Polyangiaceae bacterium]|nr:DoxX family protein [Polyangiaceae bacterium]
MSPHAIASELETTASQTANQSAQRYLVPLGRLFLSLMFIMAGFTHLSPQAVGYAAAAGVPLASIVVPASGIMAFVGGLSVTLGYKAKWGAWLIVLFLLPVTFTMHRFWAESDPMMAQVHMGMFLKNFGLMGGALLITQLGSGPLSLDARKR